MKNLVVVLLFFASLGAGFAQKKPNEQLSRSAPFEVGFAVEGMARGINSGTFLGDAYQLSLGYRIKSEFGVRGIPGLGIYFGSQRATIQENNFLGGFFSESQWWDIGVYLYHKKTLSEKITLRGELGYGSLQVNNIQESSRFRLDYGHYFANVGGHYSLFRSKSGLDIDLIGTLGVGLLRGASIQINPADRRYIQRATDLQAKLGVQWTIR